MISFYIYLELCLDFIKIKKNSEEFKKIIFLCFCIVFCDFQYKKINLSVVTNEHNNLLQTDKFEEGKKDLFISLSTNMPWPKAAGVRKRTA